jgi:hypothetical protein
MVSFLSRKSGTKTMTYTIDKNIPMPNANGRGREKSELRLTVELMEIGDSIVINTRERKTIHNMTRSVGIAYRCKAIGSNQYRVWRTSEKGTI